MFLKGGTFTLLVGLYSCYAQSNKNSIAFSDPNLIIDVKKALIYAVEELDESSRSIWKEKIDEVLSYNKTNRGNDITYHIEAKLCQSKCRKTDSKCLPNPVNGEGGNETQDVYTVPFATRLNNFFLLPYEKRNMKISGLIPLNAKKFSFMLQNGPNYWATTSIPFHIRLEFRNDSESYVVFSHWWGKWGKPTEYLASEWLKLGEEFKIRLSFKKKDAEVLINDKYAYTYAYQIPIETTHLSIRDNFNITDIEIDAIVEEMSVIPMKPATKENARPGLK